LDDEDRCSLTRIEKEKMKSLLREGSGASREPARIGSPGTFVHRRFIADPLRFGRLRSFRAFAAEMP
jgi:hypothetical protein